MWLKDQGDQLLDKKIGWRDKSGIHGETVVSYPCTTSQTMKTMSCQKRTKTDAKRVFGDQNAQPGAPKTGCLASKVVCDHKGGLPGHSVPLERGNEVCGKNRSKRRKLSGPEPRRTADGSENRKLASK